MWRTQHTMSSAHTAQPQGGKRRISRINLQSKLRGISRQRLTTRNQLRMVCSTKNSHEHYRPVSHFTSNSLIKTTLWHPLYTVRCSVHTRTTAARCQIREKIINFIYDSVNRIIIYVEKSIRSRLVHIIDYLLLLLFRFHRNDGGECDAALQTSIENKF